MIKMFAIFDMAAERYIEPFPASTFAVAIRGFEKACRDANHPFAQSPEDYVLYSVGTFDPVLGEMEGHQAKKIAMASQYTHQQEG